MNTYELKQEARRERLEHAASNASERANNAFARADLSESTSGIPMGQPVLVGHHSENRHRNAIKKANRAMTKAIEDSNRAADLQRKADAVGTGGISSDDPDAIKKLKADIEKAEKAQRFMVAANKAVRKTLKAHAADSPEALVMLFGLLNDFAAGYGEKYALDLLTLDSCGGYGFASYQTTNNNANIRRMKKRVEQLAANAERETKETEFDGFSVVENAEENRVQFIFDGRPDAAIRTIMKRNGFRWSPRNSAWQRQFNSNGIFAARYAIKDIQEATA